jgi:squalene synthase HpnC
VGLSPQQLDAAYRHCEAIARNHYENFPVGSRLLPRRSRRYLYSIYAFARGADDFADEPEHAGRRRERIAEWRARLERCAAGEADDPVFAALGNTIRVCRLPVSLLDDLLKAFEQDTRVRRYETFEDLVAYCRWSANPVGRLVLTVFGHTDEEWFRMSDAICTALQLANHWQDVAIDLKKDRIYLPREDMNRFGYTERELQAQVCNDAFRRLMAFQVDRGIEWFDRGRPLPGRVGGRLGAELRCIWLGGTRILRRIRAVDYDVFRRRPRLSLRDKAAIVLRGLVAGRHALGAE